MAQYMLAAHSNAGEAREPMTDDQVTDMVQKVTELESEMKSTGTWVFGGRLHAPDTATVVRASGGEVTTTDGPFAESKEHLGGFYVIEADDLDAALHWAARTSELVGAAIEVRPLADDPGA